MTKTTTQPVFYNGVRFPGSWTEAQRDVWLKQRAREKFRNGHAWRAEKELKVAIHGKAREETREAELASWLLCGANRARQNRCCHATLTGCCN